MRQNLLIELLTEELPPKSLKKLSESFSKLIAQHLFDTGLIQSPTAYKYYATPRRLAVHIEAVLDQQSDRKEQRRGPAVKAAFDTEGNPSKAAEGFARSCGVKVEELQQLETDKGAWLVFDKLVAGQAVTEIAQQALEQSIKQLPIAKRMRWGDSAVEFVRPVHRLLALYGSDVLVLSVLGLSAGRDTLGHRFHHPKPLVIDNADNYASVLEQKAYVIADYQQRQEIIRQQAIALADKEHNAEVVIDPSLLEEVTGLVEWPVALLGEFDVAFLDVPAEALIASMKDHQKYFYLQDKHGALLSKFITVSNIQSKDPKRVVLGNERVLRARLADGQFFWNADRKIRLDARLNSLSKVMFHAQLGSVADKTTRITKLSAVLADKIGADVPKSCRAASLCKADLVSDMVGEFAALQGVMGHYYARNDGEASEVCEAIEQHYWPKFSGDQLPETPIAQTVALADRLDSLIGIFATGEKPSGVKDPYALRRAALGTLRILGEKRLPLSLEECLNAALEVFSETPNINAIPTQSIKSDVHSFIMERLKSLYLGKAYSIHEFNAVAAIDTATIYNFDDRIQALQQFYLKQSEAADALAAANKRISNILKKNPASSVFNASSLVDPAEIKLNDTLDQLELDAQTAFSTKNYYQGLIILSALREPIDMFFEQVMVMANDESLRLNRLALLARIRDLFLQVADISFLIKD